MTEDKELIERMVANEAALAEECGSLSEPQETLAACTDFDEVLNFTCESLDLASQRLRTLVEENERLRDALEDFTKAGGASPRQGKVQFSMWRLDALASAFTKAVSLLPKEGGSTAQEGGNG